MSTTTRPAGTPGSRVPGTCSQSIAFMNEPDADPLYIGQLHGIPSAS